MTATKPKTVQPADMVAGRTYVVTYVGRVNDRARFRGEFLSVADRGKNAIFESRNGGRAHIRMSLMLKVQDVSG